MDSIKSICVISNGYPTSSDPSYAFIRPVVVAMADMGIHCTVIAPQSVLSVLTKRKMKRPQKWIDKTEKGSEIVILQPFRMSLTNHRILGFSINTLLENIAIKRAFRQIDVKPEVIYAHFWNNGIVAAEISKRNNNIPVVVSCGESKIWVFEKFPQKYINVAMKQIKGVICVSTKNKNECIKLGLISDNQKVAVLPNGFNPKEFYSISKSEARKRLKIDSKLTIAVFVGEFCNRKGYLRLIEASKEINDLHLIMIGKGEDETEDSHILFQGRCPHDEIVLYLNSADFFVLPTLAEGCCNAIIEAIACGLPIISSDREFNYDILDNSNAILIDPMDTQSIHDAMTRLVDSPKLREQMSLESLEKSKQLTIDERVKRIIDFIDSLI